MRIWEYIAITFDKLHETKNWPIQACCRFLQKENVETNTLVQNVFKMLTLAPRPSAYKEVKRCTATRLNPLIYSQSLKTTESVIWNVILIKVQGNLADGEEKKKSTAGTDQLLSCKLK